MKLLFLFINYLFLSIKVGVILFPRAEKEEDLKILRSFLSLCETKVRLRCIILRYKKREKHKKNSTEDSVLCEVIG